MSDSKGEPTRGAPGEPPDSRLAERLLARRTHSLGVIDVRRAEAHYARIMDWLAARTPLLEHLRSRYGLTEAASATQFGLALADTQGRAGAEGTGKGVGPSAAPDSFAARALGQTFTAVAHVPEDPRDAPAETLRIGRRGVPTFSHAGPENPPRAGAQTARSEGVKSALGSRGVKPTLEAEPVVEHDSPSPNSVRGLRPSFDVKEIPAAPEPGASRAPLATQATRPPSPPHTAPRESAPPTVGATRMTEAEAGARSGERAGETLAHVREISADTWEGTPTPPALTSRGARRDVNPRASSEAAADGVELAFGSPGAKALESPGASRGTPETSAGTPLVVSERVGAAGAGGAAGGELTKPPASVREGRAFVVSESETGRAAAEPPLPLARSRELPAALNALGAAASREHPALPLAASPGEGARAGEMWQRQHASAHEAGAPEQPPAGVSETFATARVRAGATPPGINVERLTEQVSRHLARRLLVERERRGLGRK